ncbi:MAG: hypothetical protein ACOX8Q_01755 [Christensenellales bacterium]|jgi:hypothetical protein
MFEHSNFTVNYNVADVSNLDFSDNERAVLKDLAKKVAELAALPRMADNKKLWTDHNGLKKTRPVILCDPENGWNEIITDDQIVCSNSLARHWELWLRKLIFWGTEMNDDYVIEPFFDVPHRFSIPSWGIKGGKEATGKARLEGGGAYHIDTILDNYAQLTDIIEPILDIDYKTTNITEEIAHEIFDGILTVRQKTTWYWSFGLTDEFVFLRGMANMFTDMYDYPDEVHKLMGMICDNMWRRLDFLEENHLMRLNNDGTYVGSGGIGFTDELPSPGFNGHVKTKDMWGLAESQVTVGVSPGMFSEFIFPYHKKLMERFGLTCYGCCEPMDDRIDLIKTVKNLRRVSVSAWANRELMADKLKHDYVYSAKPSPSFLAVPNMDENAVREDIRDVLKKAKDCCLELIMKDNHTLANKPENLTNWVKIAREEIEAM